MITTINTNNQPMQGVIDKLRFLYADDKLTSNDNFASAFKIFSIEEDYQECFYLLNNKCSQLREAKSKLAVPAKSGSDVKIDIDAVFQSHFNKCNFKMAIQTREKRDTKVVLVVDDQAFILQLIEQLLRNNFKVIKALDPIDALDKYFSYAPDITLMDWNLPKINGYQMLERLVQIDKDHYIVMLTVNTRATDVRRAINVGAKGYMAKPISKKVMDACIDQYFDSQKSLLKKQAR